MAPSTDMAQFREVLHGAKHIIVVAGAGLSAASGIPTFRGAGGLWRSHDAMSLATPQAFARNPSLVWQFYHYRRNKALQAEPNAAHRLLARLSAQPTFLRQVAPEAQSFHVITQNIDRLSVRALEELGVTSTSTMTPCSSQVPDSELALESSLIEMHGRLFDVSCTSGQPGHGAHDLSPALTPALAAISDADTTATTSHNSPEIPLEDLPRCATCGKLGRPGVVWFGERPLHMKAINVLVKKADVCLVVGTSSTVYPAAGYAYEVQEHGGVTAVFNLDASDGDEKADFLFRGPCEVELARVLGLATESG